MDDPSCEQGPQRPQRPRLRKVIRRHMVGVDPRQAKAARDPVPLNKKEAEVVKVNQPDSVFLEYAADRAARRQRLVKTERFHRKAAVHGHVAPYFLVRFSGATRGDDAYAMTALRQVVADALHMRPHTRSGGKEIIR